MSQKRLSKVLTYGFVVVLSKNPSISPSSCLEDVLERKLCVDAVRRGGRSTTMSREHVNVNSCFLKCRSYPSSHSSVGDRLMRPRVAEQKACAMAQGTGCRDVMF